MKKKPARKISTPKKPAKKYSSLFKDNQEWFIWMASTVIISLLVFYLFGFFGNVSPFGF